MKRNKVQNEMAMSMTNLTPYESFHTKPMTLKSAKNLIDFTKRKNKKLKLTNNSE